MYRRFTRQYVQTSQSRVNQQKKNISSHISEKPSQRYPAATVRTLLRLDIPAVDFSTQRADQRIAHRVQILSALPREMPSAARV